MLININILLLFAGISNRNEEVDKLSHQVSQLISTNEDLARSKVSLEMRTLELEEQRDRWIEERQELNDNLNATNDKLKVCYKCYQPKYNWSTRPAHSHDR